MTSTDARAALRACPMFGDLDEADVDALASVAEVVTVEAGERVWRAGTPAAAFRVLARGAVRVSRALPTGGRAIMLVFGAPESIGDVAAVAGDRYPADCDALCASEVVRLPREAVLAIAGRHAPLAERIAQAPVAHVRRLQQMVVAIHGGSVETRLASALLLLCTRSGQVRPGGSIFLPLPLARRDLAELVGARVESVIRVLARWQREALVDTRENGFVLPNVAALEAVAGHRLPDIADMARHDG